MKKQILNIGKTLNKVEQKSILGGLGSIAECSSDCPGDEDPVKCDGPSCTVGHNQCSYFDKNNNWLTKTCANSGSSVF